MSFMDGCKPQGPLAVLTPEEQRVTDYYQIYTPLIEHIAGILTEALRSEGLLPSSGSDSCSHE